MSQPRRRGKVAERDRDANRRFARIAQIEEFAILDLSQEHEELTPTLKVKRNVVYQRYAEVFRNLYDEG